MHLNVDAMLTIWTLLSVQLVAKVLSNGDADALFRNYWQWYLQDRPETATSLGDHRYDDRLDSWSIEAFEERKGKMLRFLTRAYELLSRTAEDRDANDNLQRFAVMLEYEIKRINSKKHLFPTTFMEPPDMELLFLPEYIQPEKSSDYSAYISRYRAFPEQITQKIDLMKEGIRTNFTMNEKSLWKLSDSTRNQDVLESPFFAPFLDISLPAEEADQESSLLNAAEDAVGNYVIPALEEMDDFLQNEYLPHTRPGIGVSSLPDGQAYYRSELGYYLTDSKVTAEEIHEMGLLEVQRIAQEMDEVIHSLGLTLTRQEFNILQNNVSQFFETEDEAVGTYKDVLENKIAPKLPLLFKNIPEKRLNVQKVPFQGGPKAYYLPPPTGSSTAGTLFINPTPLRNLPRYEVVTVALHEGIPGHHLQMSYSMEQTGLPEFRKGAVQSNAYAEGWALYSEYLGYEMGLYQDPFQRYGHLSEEIFRACRLVVDTGIHMFGWSRQEAIDYMRIHSASSLSNIEKEVNRYITWPGQACSYKYGELKIKELRKRAETELGSSFDLREFHDVILRNNGPMELIEKEVNIYIESCKENSDTCSGGTS